MSPDMTVTQVAQEIVRLSSEKQRHDRNNTAPNSQIEWRLWEAKQHLKTPHNPPQP